MVHGCLLATVLLSPAILCYTLYALYASFPGPPPLQPRKDPDFYCYCQYGCYEVANKHPGSNLRWAIASCHVLRYCGKVAFPLAVQYAL